MSAAIRPYREGDEVHWVYGVEKDIARHFVVTRALRPVGTETTIRVRNGKLSPTDGPSAESEEQLRRLR
jgi:hypothetical protein